MIVTIDGPAGAGKSSAARGLALRLGFKFLDTGAMYRAVALAGMREGVDWSKPEELTAVARGMDLFLTDDRVFLAGEEVTAAIRTAEVTRLTRFAADNVEVRAHLSQLQQQMAADADVVTEGRDQGTVVFPDAACKIFLTATPEERARRRQEEIQQRGELMPIAEVLAQQELRDEEDRARPVGALRQAEDAIEVYTDGLSLEEVVDRLEALVVARQENTN